MRIVVLVMLVGCSGNPPAKPTMQTTIPELAYFVGRWSARAVNPTTQKAFELDYRVEPMLRGGWLAGHGTAAALDLEIRDVWGKDAVTGEIVRTIFDSQRTYGTVRSRGWTGNTLVLEGPVVTIGGPGVVRETIERISDDEFHARWEAKTGDTWSAYSIEQLRRVR